MDNIQTLKDMILNMKVKDLLSLVKSFDEEETPPPDKEEEFYINLPHSSKTNSLAINSDNTEKSNFTFLALKDLFQFCYYSAIDSGGDIFARFLYDTVTKNGIDYEVVEGDFNIKLLKTSTSFNRSGDWKEYAIYETNNNKKRTPDLYFCLAHSPSRLHNRDASFYTSFINEDRSYTNIALFK